MRNLREINNMYDEMLDEVYGMVEVAGMNYDTSSLLKEADPIAYRCGLLDWVDNEIIEGNITEEEGERL